MHHMEGKCKHWISMVLNRQSLMSWCHIYVNYLLHQQGVSVTILPKQCYVSSSGTVAPDMVLTRWDSHLEYVQQQLQHLKSAKMYLDKV